MSSVKSERHRFKNQSSHNFLVIFLGFISLFTTLVMGQLTEIISDNEIYEIPKYYLIIDACLLIYIFVSRSFKEHHILFILLFTIVNASTVDLLSIRFEFILHIFRIAIIFEILNGFLKLDKINMNNLKPIVLSTLPLLAIFITSSIVSFKDF